LKSKSVDSTLDKVGGKKFSLGLTNVYRDQKSEHSTFLRVFFGLPFLSPNDVDHCFIDNIIAIQPTGDKIQVFLDYVFET